MDMGILMDLDPGPDSGFRRLIRQGPEGRPFQGEQAEGLLAGAAVDTVARLAEDPFAQLLISVGEAAKFTGGHEAPLEILDTRFHPAFLFRVPGRTGINPEAVALGILRVRTLSNRIVETGPGDRAPGIVNDDSRRHPAEPLECPAVTFQPGLRALVKHQLGILVTGERQGHQEEPGLQLLAAANVHLPGTGTEIHLPGFARLECQVYGGPGPINAQAADESVYRGVAPPVTVDALKGALDRGDLDALAHPRLHLGPVGLY